MEEARNVFQKCGVDASTVIDRESLARLLTALGENYSEYELDSALGAAGADSHGKVCLEALLQWISQDRGLHAPTYEVRHEDLQLAALKDKLDISPAQYLAPRGRSSTKLPCGAQFTVNLVASAERRWGLVAGARSSGLYVDSIKQDSLLELWNVQNPDREALVGDKIISVNGFRAYSEEFAEALRSAVALDIILERGPKGSKAGEVVRDCVFIDMSPFNGVRQSLNDPFSMTWSDPARWWALLQAEAKEDAGCGAAIGSLVGLAIGDAVGHPLEFISVESRSSCLLPGLAEGELLYQSPLNTFKLQPGQWTDDCSMALCLADSLLACGGYHGGDARMRWHMWWYHGYCNAFRHDDGRSDRRSVGLGGNVGQSLRDIDKWASEVGSDTTSLLDALPVVYASDTHDSGNGSIMRVSPVPIAYHKQMAKAMAYAELQSRATHPGNEAAACCRFMAFFIASSLNAHRKELNPASNTRSFIEDQVQEFLQKHLHDCDEGQCRLRALLLCEPPSLRESNWDWKRSELAISEALSARDGSYNGYPVKLNYFGSYCMDGLAMVLWALWHTADFSSCIQRVVNLLGDADTTGAIAGQLAGALYGWRGIMSDAWGQKCVANLCRWDPYAEVGMRAALLYHHGPEILTPCSLRS